MAYSYIISIDIRYFTPALGIVAGLLGGLGIVARDVFSEKERFDDIPLKDLATYVLFGILALILGYILVYYFVPVQHGKGTLYEFLKINLGLLDVVGSALGSSSSSAIPVILAHKFRTLIKKLRSYPASE